jgi:cytochrome P450
MALGIWIYLAVVALTILFFKPICLYFYDPKQLRRFPNAHPFSGITNLWFAYEAFLGRRYLTLQKKHQGLPAAKPVLRVGPNHLSFYSREAIKDIHGHGTLMEKGIHYDLLAGTYRHLADVVDRGEHTRKRKMLATAFSQGSLSKYDDLVGQKMLEFTGQMDRYCQSEPLDPTLRPVVDYRRWAILYTQEVIAGIGLSADLGFIRSGDDLTTAERADGSTYQARYRDSIEGSMHRDCVFSAFPTWYHGLVTVTCGLIPQYRGYARRAEAFGDIVRHQVRRRIAQCTDEEDPHSDLMSALLRDRKNESLNLEFGELFAEANVILNAGSDSTGIAMTNTINSLLHCPRAMKTLQEELDVAIPDPNDIPSFEDVKLLPYLRACIDESMRMNAPSQFSLPRKTPPAGA